MIRDGGKTRYCGVHFKKDEASAESRPFVGFFKYVIWKKKKKLQCVGDQTGSQISRPHQTPTGASLSVHDRSEDNFGPSSGLRIRHVFLQALQLICILGLDLFIFMCIVVELRVSTSIRISVEQFLNVRESECRAYSSCIKQSSKEGFSENCRV